MKSENPYRIGHRICRRQLLRHYGSEAVGETEKAAAVKFDAVANPVLLARRRRNMPAIRALQMIAL